MAGRNKLTNRNLMFAFIALFAIAGGIQLLRSYAAANPELTLNPGTYKLSEFATDEKNTAYQFDLSKNLRYCVSEVEPSKYNFVLVHTETVYESVGLDSGSNSSRCFNPTFDYTKAVISLPQGLITSGVLTVHTK